MQAPPSTGSQLSPCAAVAASGMPCTGAESGEKCFGRGRFRRWRLLARPCCPTPRGKGQGCEAPHNLWSRIRGIARHAAGWPRQGRDAFPRSCLTSLPPFHPQREEAQGTSKTILDCYFLAGVVSDTTSGNTHDVRFEAARTCSCQVCKRVSKPVPGSRWKHLVSVSWLVRAHSPRIHNIDKTQRITT